MDFTALKFPLKIFKKILQLFTSRFKIILLFTADFVFKSIRPASVFTVSTLAACSLELDLFDLFFKTIQHQTHVAVRQTVTGITEDFKRTLSVQLLTRGWHTKCKH